jgi:hypothetical protein
MTEPQNVSTGVQLVNLLVGKQQSYLDELHVAQREGKEKKASKINLKVDVLNEVVELVKNTGLVKQPVTQPLGSRGMSNAAVEQLKLLYVSVRTRRVAMQALESSLLAQIEDISSGFTAEPPPDVLTTDARPTNIIGSVSWQQPSMWDDVP